MPAMIKINVPFRFVREVAPLVDAGAEELYCGYVPSYWRGRYTDLEFERKGGNSSFRDIRQLRRAVAAAHRRRVPVAVTVNGLYVAEQYPMVRRILKDIATAGVDAYIVADMGLLLMLREAYPKARLHISTGATVFNTEAARFFSQLGAARIVLDRQTSIGVMARLARELPAVEFEAFIINTLCVYIDGFCTFMHGYSGQQARPVREQRGLAVGGAFDTHAAGDACCQQYQVTVRNPALRRMAGSKAQPTFFKQLIDGPECGACALYDMARAHVASVKIVGRQLSPYDRIRSIRFIRECRDILTRNPRQPREVFFERVQQAYRRTFGYKSACRGNNCYYPDVVRP